MGEAMWSPCPPNVKCRIVPRHSTRSRRLAPRTAEKRTKAAGMRLSGRPRMTRFRCSRTGGAPYILDRMDLLGSRCSRTGGSCVNWSASQRGTRGGRASRAARPAALPHLHDGSVILEQLLGLPELVEAHVNGIAIDLRHATAHAYQQTVSPAGAFGGM